MLIGGGENGRTSEDGSHVFAYETVKIDQEIVKLAKKAHPNFLFIGHADVKHQERYFQVMKNIYADMYQCNCRILHSDDLKTKAKVEELIDWADIIYVGGGNTRNLMNLWKDTGFDKTFFEAHKKGKVICGISAGANLWFRTFCSNVLKLENNNPDAPYIALAGFGIFDVFFTPHSNQPGRIDFLNEYIKENGGIGLALRDGAAIEIKDDMYRVINCIEENDDWPAVLEKFYCEEEGVSIEMHGELEFYQHIDALFEMIGVE